MKKLPEDRMEKTIQYYRSNEFKSEMKIRLISAFFILIIGLPTILILALFSIKVPYLPIFMIALIGVILIVVRAAVAKNRGEK